MATKEEKRSQVHWGLLARQVTRSLAEDCTEAGLQRVREEGSRKAGRNDSRDDDSKKTSKSGAGAGGSAACCEVRGQGKSKSGTRGLRLPVCSNWGPGRDER